MALPAPFAAAADRASTAVRSVGQSAALYAGIALVGLTGAGFLLAALYIWLAETISPLAAALIIGAGLLVIAGITLAVMIAQARKKQRETKRAAANAAVLASSLSLTTTAIRLVSRMGRGRLLLPALAALAAGWYLSSGGGDDAD